MSSSNPPSSRVNVDQVSWSHHGFFPCIRVTNSLRRFWCFCEQGPSSLPPPPFSTGTILSKTFTSYLELFHQFLQILGVFTFLTLPS